MIRLFFLLLAVIACSSARAQPAATEADLVLRLVEALKMGNRSGYIRLFPEAELLAKSVMKNTEATAPLHQQMAQLLEYPERLFEFDGDLDSVRYAEFDSLRARGETLGVRWQGVRFARFELERTRLSRDTLWEKVAPVRFLGYVYVQDPVSGKNYAFTVGDVMQIEGKWYGGTLTRIFEAGTKFEFDQHLASARKAERKGGVYVPGGTPAGPDTTTNAEESGLPRKVVLERKYYTGTFDDEIPVQLYIRGLKGECGPGPCLWEALFKFGDQDEYQAMTVTRTDGKWILAEDPGPGAMELELEGSSFTGQWTSSADNTGYEVKLTETAPSNKKLRVLETVFATLAQE